MVSPDTLLGGRIPTGTAPTVTSPDDTDGVALPLSLQPLGGGVGMLVDANGVPMVGDDGMPILRSMDAPGGTGSTGAGAQWRPGELDLRNRELAQRLDEITLQGGVEADAAIAAHENAIKLLEIEMASASEMQKDRIQAEIDLENLRHENNLAELEIRIIADRKNLIFSEGQATGRTLIQEQGATKRALLGLGPDVAAQAAGLSGQVTRGITPQQMAVGQAKEFINQPLPQMNMDMTVDQMLESLTGMQGIQAPSLSGPMVGMAKGGIIEMEKRDGKFEKKAVLVGDGAGIIPGVTEVLTVDRGKVEVIPLAGAAQFGARIGGTGTIPGPSSPRGTEDPWGNPLPGYPPTPKPWPWPPPGDDLGFEPWLPGGQPLLEKPYLNPLVQNILQNLQPLFRGSMFGNVPQAQGYAAPWGPYGPLDPFQPTGAPGPGGAIQFTPPGGMTPMDAMSQLGVAPQLIRTGTAAGERHTYYIEGGKRYYIPGGGDPDTLLALGLQPQQVVQVTPAAIEQYESGGVFTGLGAQAAGAVGEERGGGAIGAPLIEPTSGAILPAIHKMAGRWGQLSAADLIPILSYYKSAGRGPEVISDILQTFTPAGRQTRRIGGVGMWN